MRSSLIRIRDVIINLDNVVSIELDQVYDNDPEEAPGRVLVRFNVRGSDRLDEGDNVAEPYTEVFEGDEAEALRSYLDKLCPDIMEGE